MNSCTNHTNHREIKKPSLPLRGDDRTSDQSWDRPVAPQRMSEKPMERVANV